MHSIFLILKGWHLSFSVTEEACWLSAFHKVPSMRAAALEIPRKSAHFPLSQFRWFLPFKTRASCKSSRASLAPQTVDWESFCKLRIHLQCRRPGFDPWIAKISWRRAWQPTPVFLPGESPWMEEPGGLQSVGSQRVGHDWVTKRSTTQEVLKAIHFDAASSCLLSYWGIFNVVIWGIILESSCQCLWSEHSNLSHPCSVWCRMKNGGWSRLRAIPQSGLLKILHVILQWQYFSASWGS